MAINYEKLASWSTASSSSTASPRSSRAARRFSFSALVVVGDQRGYVGAGLGKANESSRSDSQGHRTGEEESVSRFPWQAPPSPTKSKGRLAAGTVLLRPASPGTGVIAGGAVRPVLEVAGIQDISHQVHRNLESPQRHPRHH